jgi:hypothetical protein
MMPAPKELDGALFEGSTPGEPYAGGIQAVMYANSKKRW